MANKYSYILFLFFLFLISACKKDCSFLPSKENFLVRTQWKMESFVDHGENISYEPTTLVYEFRHDGTFIVYPSDSLPPHYTTWEFVEKKEYIRIGSNTFKVKIISKKLLGLQYGNIDIFYVPV